MNTGSPRTAEALLPDWIVPPGEVLRDELEVLGMTQADLALRTGLSAKHVNQVVKGVVPLSTDVALLLERATGVPSRTWTALESQYRNALARTDSVTRLAEHTGWARAFPVAELTRRGHLPPGVTGGELVQQLLRFFGVAEPVAWERLYSSAAFRRAQHSKIDVEGTTAWLRLAELAALDLARELDAAKYSARALRQLLPALRGLTAVDDDRAAFTELQEECARVGVLVVLVPKWKGLGVNGATRWLGDRPIVALSDRYPYQDVLWFSFFHELGHVLLHPKRATYVERAAAGDDQDGSEAQADAFAATTLLPEPHPQALRTIRHEQDVRQVAASAGVGVGVVAGRLAHDTGDWRAYSCLRARLTLTADN